MWRAQPPSVPRAADELSLSLPGCLRCGVWPWRQKVVGRAGAGMVKMVEMSVFSGILERLPVYIGYFHTEAG
jgi:hypothetical protein